VDGAGGGGDCVVEAYDVMGALAALIHRRHRYVGDIDTSIHRYIDSRSST
jgi:hypothetical protein